MNTAEDQELPTDAPPPARRGWPIHPLLIVGGVVALILLCSGAIFAGIAALNRSFEPVNTSAEAFMGALRDGDYVHGFDLSTPALQQTLGTPRGLQNQIAPDGKQPKTWSFNSRTMGDTEATFQGTATYANGNSGPVQLHLAQEGDTWKVAAFDFQ